MVAPKRLVFVAALLVSCVFWITSIMSASNGGYFENEWAVQTMVLGGAISMVGAAIAEFW